MLLDWAFSMTIFELKVKFNPFNIQITNQMTQDGGVRVAGLVF